MTTATLSAFMGLENLKLLKETMGDARIHLKTEDFVGAVRSFCEHTTRSGGSRESLMELNKRFLSGMRHYAPSRASTSVAPPPTAAPERIQFTSDYAAPLKVDAIELSPQIKSVTFREPPPAFLDRLKPVEPPATLESIQAHLLSLKEMWLKSRVLQVDVGVQTEELGVTADMYDGRRRPIDNGITG